MSSETPAEDWDVIVIGTGMGGGTIGRALAEAGQKVLFLEQGRAGHRSERNGLSPIFLPEARLVRGLWPTPLRARVDGLDSTFYAPLGAGVGGSSAFYAATLERPERHDLEATPRRPHPTGGWPVGFDAMLPWYDRAARLYSVRGSPDPLSTEPPLPLAAPQPETAVERSLADLFRAAGLHPYRTHSAIAHPDRCLKCLGTKCPRACKMDGRSAGVEPALATGRARLDTGSRVVRIRADGNRVTGIEVARGGETHVLTARRYVLSAGALGSAHLLLASASEHWPDGLANRSGLVGRNLMFHLDEMFALWPPRGVPDSGATNGISLRDLYHHDADRFGKIQAMGIRASYGEIAHFLDMRLARSRFANVPGLKKASRLPAAIAARIFGSAQIFVGLIEDLPNPGNRLVLDPADPEALSIIYNHDAELLRRRKAFRKAIRKAFRGHRRWFLSKGPTLNFGHPCGTVRFGDTPETSVLDAGCRAHDLDNLWVVDSSFMPTSMSVNPSLTIAANALRVADDILKKKERT